MRNLRDYEKMCLSLAFMGVAISIMMLWNTYDIKQLEKQNTELEKRLNQLEVDYKIYEHDFREE